jgi:hypothetical protein
MKKSMPAIFVKNFICIAKNKKSTRRATLSTLFKLHKIYNEIFTDMEISSLEFQTSIIAYKRHEKYFSVCEITMKLTVQF